MRTAPEGAVFYWCGGFQLLGTFSSSPLLPISALPQAKLKFTQYRKNNNFFVSLAVLLLLVTQPGGSIGTEGLARPDAARFDS
jgi:hypothetical protein